jgi:hypothetical protein
MADDVNINAGENINPQEIPMPVDANIEATEVVDNGIGVGEISNNSFGSDTFSENGNMQMSFAETLPEINFQDAVPDVDGFDVQTFSDAVEFATEGMPNLEINQPFIDMIDAAAVDIDKYVLPMPSSDMNSPYPGTASTRFNPFNESSGNINLNSRNGRRNLMSHTQSLTKQLFPNKTPGYQDPFVFGTKKFEMDRYYHHPRFTDLGFHPFANNEELYHAQSSKWDNFTRTRGQWAATFGPAFTSGWRSIGDMFTGDTFAGDLIGAEAMTDSMRIGRSSGGGVRGFFNDLFLNSSYTVGIISSIALEELVLWGAAALQGGMNPASDALAVTRTAANLNRLRKLFSGKTYANAAANLMQTLKNIDNAKDFFRVARSGAYGMGKGLGQFFTPETLHQFKRLKTSAKAGENLTNMAKATSMFGGFYMDFRNANLAWSESKMEGGIEELEMRDELYSIMKREKGGVEPTAEELEMNGGMARAAGLTTTLINAPIIYLSNKLVLGHALRGFKRMGRFMDNALDTAAGRIRRNPKTVKEGFYDLGEEWIFGETFRRMYKAGMKGSMKHLGASALKYSTMNLAEGFQELAQEATANGVGNYYKGLYEQALAGATDVQIADMVSSYNAGKKGMLGDFRTTENMTGSDRVIEAAKKGIGSQMSGQGVHTFLSGFMMGGLIQGPQKVMFQTMPNLFQRTFNKDKFNEYQAAKEQTIKRTVEVLNEVYSDPTKYFDPKKVNMLLQKELNSRMVGDSYADNVHEFINNRDHSIFSHLYTVMQSGQIDEFKDMMQSFTKLDNKGIKEAFKGVDSSPQKLRSRAQAMVEKIDQMKDAYKEINDEYVNPFNPKKYKKGTRKHHEEVIRSIAYDNAKMMMMFSKDTFEQSLKRSNDIMESFASDPILASISAADISALTSYSGLIKEIDLLKAEVKVKATTAEEKKIIADKKKKLKLLQDYYDVFTAKENQTSKGGLVVRDNEGNIIKEGGTFDKRKMGKLKPAFEAYLKFIAEQNDDYVMPAKLMESLKKIVDLGYLKGRAQDNFKAMEILMNPDHLVQLAERMALTMKSTWEEYKKETNLYLKVKKYYDQQERTEFIKALAAKGIYPDPDQVKLFFEEGTMPRDYFDEEGKITPQSDPTAWKIIEGLQQTFRQTQAQAEAETEVDDRSGTELDEQLEDDAGKDITVPKEDDDDPMSSIAEQQANKIAMLQQFLDQDENTRKILKAKYAQYKIDNLTDENSLMTYPQWLRSKNGGAGILRSRYELSKMYEAQSQKIKDEKTFEEWVDSNSKNPLIVGSNGILTKNNVTISDVSITKSEIEGIKEDKLQANEKPVSTDKKTGVNVIETTVTNREGDTETFYTVVDNNNVNAADKYSGLDPQGNIIKKVYPSKNEALKAAKYIKNNMPKKSTFSFGGLEISTGDIVEDSSGKQYIVRSTAGTRKNNNNLWIIPVKKKGLKKGEDGRQYLTEKQWNDQGWKKSLESKPDLKADNLTRITEYEPVKFYPFDSRKVDEKSKLGYLKKGANETDIDVQENWQKFLRDLSPLEMLNLELVVEKNPEYDVIQKEIKEGNFRTYRTNKGYSNNPGLARGANELEITLMVGKKPVGKLVGLGATILRDLDGTVIDGTQITEEQAERLFITNNDPLAATKIRKRYAYAQLINRDLKAKLGGNSAGKFKLSDFPSINFAISAGKLAFPDKGSMDTPWQDLNYSSINGKIMIADIRTVYKDGKAYTQVRWESDIDRTTKSGQQEFQDNLNEINAAIGNTTKAGKQLTDVSQLDMGRYVQAIKLPNGTITFVELKAEKLETEEVNDILFGEKGLLNQQKKTLVENFKDGKLKPEVDGFDPLQMNKQFNAEFNDMFYVSLKPGEHLSFNVTPYGKLAVNYTNRLTGVEYTIFLNDDIMEKVDTTEKFVATVIANFNADQKSKKAKDKDHKIVKIDGFNADSFVNNIPKTINAESLTGVVSARIMPDIRSNLQAQFVYTNSADIQSITNNRFSTKGMDSESVAEDEQTPEEVVLTDEVFKDLLANDFDNIPDSIVKDIKSKLIAQQELTDQERMIVDALAEKDLDLTQESDVSTRDAATSKNEDGNQAESNNETIIELINKKEQQLKKEEKAFVNKTRVLLKEDGLKGSELNKELRKRKREDEDLQKLRDEIDDLKNNKLGYKILDTFDGQDAENIDRFIAWAKLNLPSFIQIADIEALGARLKNNGMTAGAFAIELSKISGNLDLVGKIYVGEKNPFKYHEAFHAVFRMLLSEAEVTKYLKIARKEKLAELKKEGKTLNQALKELRLLSPLYQKMSQQELEDTLFEEYLADKFEEFKTNPGNTNTSSEVKSIFNRFIEWIKNLFLSYSPNELDILFNDIDTGKYKSSSLANNRFTSDLINISELEKTTGVTSSIAFKIRKGDPVIAWRPAIINGVLEEKGKKVYINKYFSQEEQNTIVATIGAMYLNKVREVADSQGFEGQYNPDAILREAIDDYIEIYNPEREDNFYLDREDFMDIEDDLTDYFEGLSSGFSDIKKAVEEYLTLFDVKVENQLEDFEQVDFTADGIVKAADQWDSEVNQIGGFKSLSAEIRKFIATTTIKTTDRFGNQIDQPVNYAEAYNGLLKSMKNTKDPYALLYKMEMYALNGNENTAAVVDRIMEEIGLNLGTNELLNREYNINDAKNKLFLQSIIKGFTQFRVDYIFAENDPKRGITNLFAANHKDDAHTQTDRWGSDYGTKFERLSKDGRFRSAAASAMDVLLQNLTLGEKGKISDKELDVRASNISIDMKNYLGISLSPNYIKFSIIHALENPTDSQLKYISTFSEAEPITSEGVEEIIFSINSHSFIDGKYGANLFLNVNDSVADNDVNEDGAGNLDPQLGDVKNRLKKFARGNASFDETVGNTVFLDPKGNLIYAHQQPTFHLEKVAELNSEEAIAALKETDGFLDKNYLLNNPKFMALASQGKLRISRVIGSKLVKLEATEEGDWKSGKGLDLSNQPGKSFGESSPAEFIATLINTYLLDFNATTGKVKTTSYETEDEFGKKIDQEFASALVDIKVIAESNTGDFISLPIIKAVEKVKGKVQLREAYIDNVLNEVETEYNRIKREVNQEEGYTEDTIDNYNDFTSIDDINDDNPTKSKAAKLFKTGELVVKRIKPIARKRQIETPYLGKQEQSNIVDGSSKLIFRDGNYALDLGVNVGDSVIIQIKDVNYLMTNRGTQRMQDLSWDDLKADLGSDISTEYNKISHKYKVKVGSEDFYVRTKKIQEFLKNKNSQNVVEIELASDEIQVLEESGEVQSYSVDNTAKIKLEKAARAGVPFNEAIQELRKDGIKIRELIEEKLYQEFDEFKVTLTDIKATKKIDKQITGQLQLVNGKKDTPQLKESMGHLNLLANEVDHNLMQWFFNDYLNTLSINQVLLGDVAMTVKDAVDEVKRAKMQNAAGPSAESIIAAPEHGVMHPVKRISAVTFRDPQYQKKTSDGTGDKTDAQMYMTVKAFRYMMFGFGSLNTAQANLLDKVERGEEINWEDFFGNPEKGTKGYKDMNAVLNSKKLVYGDGKTFIKMSAFVLTPRLTTNPLTGEALPHREKLHNMRIKLEQMEMTGSETIGIAIPETASKMLRANVIQEEDMFNTNPVNEDNITELDARWMRMQQYVPSNKIEMIDPTQIKTLITSEQSDDVEVLLGNKKVTIGQIRRLYNKTVGDRVTQKYLNQRNLMFTFANTQNALQKSIESGKVTVDLQAFIDYARDGLQAAGSKSQFLELFETDRTGSPKFDLNNPITIQKFQELFMTFFSRGVISEKQAGTSVALVSDQGMKVIKKVIELDPETGQPIRWDVIRTQDWMNLNNPPEIRYKEFTDPEARTFADMKVGDIYIDDLRSNVAEYDSKGNLTGHKYSEFMIPPHFAEILKNLKPGQPIPEVIAKAFGTRIPSQDKHSAVNLKAVDFLPVEYGSVGVFPEELIEISGADFDIDKLYMQLKQFYMKDGEFVEYGVSEDENVLYEEYLEFQKEQMEKPGSTLNRAYKKWNKRGRRLNEVDEKVKILKTTDEIEAEWAEWSANNNNKNKGEDSKTFTSFEDLAELNVLKSKLAFAKEKGYWVNIKSEKFNPLYEKETAIESRELLGTLRMLALPVTKEEFAQYINRFDRLPYTAAQDNIILDARYSLLGNEGMTGPLFGRKLSIAEEPAVLDPLLEVWDFIQEELPELAEKVKEDGVLVDNPLGKLKAWTNNKAGANSIGAVVLPNTVVNLLKENNIKLRNKNENGQKIVEININGHNYDTFGVNYEIDPKTGKPKKDGLRTQFVISALVTAMTDNAKERLAAKLGLTRGSLAVVTNLIALGVGVKTAVMLVNHPSVKEAYFLAENKEDEFDPGVKKLIERKIKTLKSVNAEAANNARVTPVTDKILMDQIQKDRKNPTTQDITDHIATLDLFLEALYVADYTFKVQSLVTLSAGLGRDIAAMADKQRNITNLGMEMTTPQMRADNKIPFDVRKIFRGSESFYADYYAIFKEVRDLLPSVFITQTEAFNKLFGLVLDNMDKKKMTDKTIARVSKDILSYITGKAYVRSLEQSGQAQLLASLDNGIIYDEFAQKNMSINDIVIRLRKYLEGQGKENYFIQKIIFNKSTKNGTNMTGINLAEMNTWTKMSDGQITDIQNSFLDLYQDVNTRADAIHLMHYLIVKDGLQYAPNTFLGVIPAPLLEQILSSVGRAHDLFKKQNPTDDNFRSVFGQTFNEMAQELVEGYLSSRSNAYYMKSMDGKPSKVKQEGETVEGQTSREGVSVATKNWKENTPDENPNTTYVFTENINSLEEGSSRKGSGTAVIRGKDNALAIVTKKRYVYKENRASQEEGDGWNQDFQDNDQDFETFIRINRDQLSELETKDDIIFPKQLGGSLATLPERFTEWLQKELQERFELDTELVNGGLKILPTESTKVTVTDTTSKTVLYNQDEGTLVIDLLNNLKDAGFKSKKYKGKKGSFKRERWTSVKNSRQVKSNANIIEKRLGLGSIIEVPITGDKGTKTVSLVKFPLAFYTVEGAGKNKTYRFFALDKLFSPFNQADKNEFFDLNEERNIILGNRAEYKEIDMLGSMQQNAAMGSMFGERSTYADLQAAIKEQQPLVGMDKIAAAAEKTAEALAEKIAKSGAVEKHFGANITIEANENGTKASTDQGNPVDLSKLQMMSEDNTEMHGGEVVTTGAPVVDASKFMKDNAMDEDSSSPGEYKKVIDFYDNLTRFQRSKIASSISEGGLEISSVEDIIEEINNPNNQFTEEEFIEQMEKCYK